MNDVQSKAVIDQNSDLQGEGQNDTFRSQSRSPDSGETLQFQKTSAETSEILSPAKVKLSSFDPLMNSGYVNGCVPNWSRQHHRQFSR